MTTNKGKCTNSKPNMKPVILLLGCKPLLYCMLLWLLGFSVFKECITSSVEDLGQSPWKLALT